MRIVNEYRTTRIWTKTLKRLRLIAAMTNESIVESIDRLSEQEMQRIEERNTTISKNVRESIQQLAEIDKVILEDSLKERDPKAYDRFMSLVHQKEGLHEKIQQETGKTAHWTPRGYRLD